MLFLNTFIVNIICIWNIIHHGDFIKWTHFPRHWPFVRRVLRSPVRWIPPQMPVTRGFHGFLDLRLNKGWVKNRDAGDLKRHNADYDVIVIALRNSYGPCEMHELC